MILTMKLTVEYDPSPISRSNLKSFADILYLLLLGTLFDVVDAEAVFIVEATILFVIFIFYFLNNNTSLVSFDCTRRMKILILSILS